MHMSDALLNPAVGGAFWAASGGLLAWSAKKVREDEDTFKTPLMAVTAAFVFAAQMINFSIPGTGSSGHIGGGLLLAALLGPYRAFLALASVLTVQCLFFADGGLLALGCNIFNLAFFPAFIAYPLLFKPLAGPLKNRGRLAAASFIAADASLLVGAFSVVLQTVFSGITDLPFRTFAYFMLPVHAATGLMEGLVTFIVLSFVFRADSSLRIMAPAGKGVAIGFIAAALVVAGAVSKYASGHPDGLEWSVAKVLGRELIEPEKLPLPSMEYSSWTGIAGSLAVLALAGVIGYIIRRRTRTHGHV